MRSRVRPLSVPKRLRVVAVSHFAAHHDVRGAALRRRPLDRGRLVVAGVDRRHVEARPGVRVPVAAHLRGRHVPQEDDAGRAGGAGIDQGGIERTRVRTLVVARAREPWCDVMGDHREHVVRRRRLRHITYDDLALGVGRGDRRAVGDRHELALAAGRRRRLGEGHRAGDGHDLRRATDLHREPAGARQVPTRDAVGLRERLPPVDGVRIRPHLHARDGAQLVFQPGKLAPVLRARRRSQPEAGELRGERAHLRHGRELGRVDGGRARGRSRGARGLREGELGTQRGDQHHRRDDRGD